MIHTHSKYANLVTIFEKSESLVICDQEMLKGVLNRQTGKPLRNTDTLELPIVENAPEERDLLASDYPIPEIKFFYPLIKNSILLPKFLNIMRQFIVVSII